MIGYKQGDFTMLTENELLTLITKADQSDVKAMIKLAEYYRGENELDKAFKYVHKSTLYSYPEGERKLGYYYEKGIGCDKDLVKARQYYELAAMHGDVKAKYNIGLFYYHNKQFPQAFNIVKDAATSNHGKAILLLAYFYEHAVGTKQDFNLAFECYNRALELGESGIYHHLGYLSYYGYGVRKDLDAAFDYFYKGAEEKEKECYYYLGVMYAKGESVKKDHSQAFYWYMEGAKTGDIKAMYNVSIYYENGVYVPKDEEKALYWLKKSAEGGFDLAINKIQINENK